MTTPMMDAIASTELKAPYVVTDEELEILRDHYNTNYLSPIIQQLHKLILDDECKDPTAIVAFVEKHRETIDSDPDTHNINAPAFDMQMLLHNVTTHRGEDARSILRSLLDCKTTNIEARSIAEPGQRDKRYRLKWLQYNANNNSAN